MMDNMSDALDRVFSKLESLTPEEFQAKLRQPHIQELADQFRQAQQCMQLLHEQDKENGFHYE